MNTVPKILQQARRWCATQERCQQEARDKLYARGLHREQVEQVIAQLISEGFLNEQRFAEHYAVSKFRQKGWGSRKIEAALEQKQVSAPCIRAALKAIDGDEQAGHLRTLVAKRWVKEKEPNALLKRRKVIAYFLRRGFPADQVEKALER